MKKLNLFLIGFGNVGQAFAKILMEKHDAITNKYDVDVQIVGITTGSRGNIYDPKGIDIQRTLDALSREGKLPSEMCSPKTTLELLGECDYDCIMELSPLNIFTGQPATDYIKTAMRRSKHVITANKGPIAWHYRQLKDMAETAGIGFFYETVVMDGTPVFNMVEHTLKMAEVTKVEGILNTTTNFILDEMAKGCDMTDIMDRGRAMGFVEADPSMDIEGYDAAAKITALLNVLMDADITPDQVNRKGIEDITYDDIEAAASRGNVIKLVCRGTRDEDGNVVANVAPEEVGTSHLYASITGTSSVVDITTDMMKTISVVEHDPQIEQTAYGVYGDMLRVIEFIN